MVDGLLRDDQALGDLSVAKALGQQREHLELPGGKAGGIRSRARPRATGQPPLAQFAQPSGDDRGGRRRP